MIIKAVLLRQGSFFFRSTTKRQRALKRVWHVEQQNNVEDQGKLKFSWYSFDDAFVKLLRKVN